MFCGHVCARLWQRSLGCVRILSRRFLAYRSFPSVALRPNIGTFMNFFARLACSKPAHVNNPRHEATNDCEDIRGAKHGETTYNTRQRRPSGLITSER